MRRVHGSVSGKTVIPVFDKILTTFGYLEMITFHNSSKTEVFSSFFDTIDFTTEES